MPKRVIWQKWGLNSKLCSANPKSHIIAQMHTSFDVLHLKVCYMQALYAKTSHKNEKKQPSKRGAELHISSRDRDRILCVGSYQRNIVKYTKFVAVS